MGGGGGEDAGAPFVGRAEVGVEERGFAPADERPSPRLRGRGVGGVLAQDEGGVRGVVERAEHAGDVTEGVVPAAALLERAGRLALEVEEVELAVGEERLAEVVVAVDADAEAAAGGNVAEGVEVGEGAVPLVLGGEVAGGARRVALGAGVLGEEGARPSELVLDAVGEGGVVLGGGGLGLEVRGLGRGEDCVHLGGADAEGAGQLEHLGGHLLQPRRYGADLLGERGGAGHAVEELVHLLGGVVPPVALGVERLLDEAHRDRLVAAAEVGGAEEVGDEPDVGLGEVAQELELGVLPSLQPPVQLHEEAIAPLGRDEGGGVALLAGEEVGLGGASAAEPLRHLADVEAAERAALAPPLPPVEQRRPEALVAGGVVEQGAAVVGEVEPGEGGVGALGQHGRGGLALGRCEGKEVGVGSAVERHVEESEVVRRRSVEEADGVGHLDAGDGLPLGAEPALGLEVVREEPLQRLHRAAGGHRPDEGVVEPLREPDHGQRSGLGGGRGLGRPHAARVLLGHEREPVELVRAEHDGVRLVRDRVEGRLAHELDGHAALQGVVGGEGGALGEA